MGERRAAAGRRAGLVLAAVALSDVAYRLLVRGSVRRALGIDGVGSGHLSGKAAVG